jgi:NADH-quinone oxidoreductase subunit N
MNVQTVLVSMLPEHLLLAGLCLVLVLDILGRAPRTSFAVALGTVVAAAAAAAVLSAGGYAAATFVGQLSVSPATSAGKAIVLVLAVPVLMLSRDEFRDAQFPMLALASLYGACLMISADSFLTLLLGLETLSLPVYALVLLAMQRKDCAEAALKYLVLGGTATGMLLMGASLLFGWSGTLAIDAFARALDAPSALARAGAALVLCAFFLKAAIFPFHAWAPDAYQGGSVPATAYMATIVKAAVLLAVVRLFGAAELSPAMIALVAVPPLVSIVWGNITAMRQPSFRRMIAYSSIAHAGFLFFALLGAVEGRFQAIAFYLAAYGLMSLVAFTALPHDGDDAVDDRIDSLKGLFHRRPYAAVTLAIAMLSLAGIPPLPGFVAKFLVFRNVMAAGHTELAVLGLVGSYLGLYFYLRVIQYMFMAAHPYGATQAALRRHAFAASLVCLVPVALLTVFPGWALGLLRG